jgi:hypothetical protein
MRERWMVKGWNAGNRERQPREVDLGRKKAQEKELATIAACYSSHVPSIFQHPKLIDLSSKYDI